MRINFSGSIKVDDLPAMVETAVSHLKSSGIDFLQSANLYVTPMKSGRKITLVDERGTEIDYIVVSSKHRVTLKVNADRVKITRQVSSKLEP
jgi:hypothetical protein